jgi:hypothetical protein
MIHTFDSIIQEVMRQTDEAGTTGTTQTLLQEYVRAAHNLRCVEFREHFMRMEGTITTVSGQREYTLSPLFDKPILFYNTTCKTPLIETPPRNQEDERLDLSDTPQGTASQFYYSGYAAVKNQPTSASVVTAVSSNGADIGSNYQIAVKGVNTDGDITVDVLTLDGITPVVGTHTFQAGGILAVTKSGATSGTVTLTSNSGAVTLITLTPNELGKQYRKIRLLASPTTAETILYRFYRKPIYLVNNYDVPDIPYPYSQILVYDALLMFATYNTDMQSEARIVMWQQQQQNWENALRGFSKEGQTVGGRSRTVRSVDDEFDSF